MKTLRNICLLTITIAAGLVIAWSQIASAEKDNPERTIVTLKQLPAAVRATLQRESTGGTLGKIEKKIKHNRIIYEADITLDNRNYQAKLTEEGILLKKELEDKDMKEHSVYIHHDSWSFEQDKTGTVPTGWKIAETNGTGRTAVWKIVKDKSSSNVGHVVAITKNTNHDGTFNLLMAKYTNYKDPDITIMLKAIAGRIDQGGGPVWRAKDANNYYVCRWNPLEDNFRLYYVKNSKRRQIGSATVKTSASAWHQIRIKQQGSRIIAWFDGKKLIELEDTTFTQPGMVGLWVKSDGKTEFDNIKVVETGRKNSSDDKYNDKDKHKHTIALSDIPAKVLKAVNNAVAEGKILTAKKEFDDNVTTYEVTKIVDNIKYEIKATPNGTIREIEKKQYDKNDNDDND